MSCHEKMSINIVVIEDHPIVREGIVNFLNVCDDMQVIAQADTVDTMLNCMENLRLSEASIDIALLDLQLAEQSSLQHISGIVAMGIRVLVLSSAHRYETLIQAVSAGAFCFISKSILPDKLATIIIDAHHGKRYLSPDIKPKDDIRLALNELTDKELTVLKMLAGGLSNNDIAGELSVNIKTVRFHTSNILSKLDISDRTQAAVLAWRQGLVR